MSKKMIITSLMAVAVSSVGVSAANDGEAKPSTATEVKWTGDQPVVATSGFTWWWE
ncbi:hypothetical protein ACU3L3_07160 [Priestia endophytica]